MALYSADQPLLTLLVYVPVEHSRILLEQSFTVDMHLSQQLAYFALWRGSTVYTSPQQCYLAISPYQKFADIWYVL